MGPAGNYEYMKTDMRNRYEDGSSCVVGILFANPNKSFVKDEILVNIEYANERSGRYIDFFFAGYSKWHTHNDDDTTIKALRGIEWHYSTEMFNDFIEKIEQISKWKYSGETELLLIEYSNGELQFNKCISIWLDRAVKEEYIYSVSHLFEDIYRTSRKETDISSFSNKLAMKKAPLAVFDSIIRFFSKKTGGAVNASRAYSVKNLSK